MPSYQHIEPVFQKDLRSMLSQLEGLIDQKYEHPTERQNVQNLLTEIRIQAGLAWLKLEIQKDDVKTD